MSESMQRKGAESKGQQPEPAAGQVWTMPEGHVVVLGEEESGRPGFFRVNDGYYNVPWHIEHSGWSCVGVDTPAGRVMVGERRRHLGSGTVAIVVAIENDGGHPMCRVDYGASIAQHILASWPLLPPAPLATMRPGVGEGLPAAARDAVRAIPYADAHITIGGVKATGRIVRDPVYRGGEMVGTTRGYFEWDTADPAPSPYATREDVRMGPYMEGMLAELPPEIRAMAKSAFLDVASGGWLDAMAGGVQRGDETDEELRARLRASEAFHISRNPWCVNIFKQAAAERAATDPREQGPGIARLAPPATRPDVVHAWEHWTVP